MKKRTIDTHVQHGPSFPKKTVSFTCPKTGRIVFVPLSKKKADELVALGVPSEG